MGSKSIWGKGDKLTLDALSGLQIKGKWMDLAAGDGRYVPELLERVDHLVVVDIDRRVLNKLLSSVSEEKKNKIETKIFDMTKRFPFRGKIFNGVLCTGTLHLLGEKDLFHVFSEIDRVLKPKGTLIIDFATDIKRISDCGVKKPEETPHYSLGQARKLLVTLLKGYTLKIQESAFEDDLTKEPEFGFKTSGNFILLTGVKERWLS